MADRNHERADNSGVLNIAVAAVMLILAGLSVMVLDDSLDMIAPAQAVILQHR